MNIWEILSLSPTEDLGAIRRAYAAAAARYNPEEHPEEFLTVRRAYEEATAYARGRAQPADAPEQAAVQPQSSEASPQFQERAEMGGFTLPEEWEAERPFAAPALDRFLELYRSKQRRDRKQWDLWATSPEFLAVLHDPRFTRALRTAVEEAGGELTPPKEFQLVLAIVYRFRAEVYQDHTEFSLEEGAGFEGLDDVLHIAALGPLVRKLQGNDLVLSAAYRDYDALCGLAREGTWGQPALEQLRTILNQYSSTYLHEKCSGNPKGERNILSLRLLEGFFANETLPEDVYEVLWSVFDLNTAIMGRTKLFYGRLREIVLEKAPEVCAQRERFVELRTAYSDLGADVQAAGGEDSPQGQALVEQFMAREDFERAIRNRLFVREEILPHWCNWFTNPHLLRKLLDIYEANSSLPYARDVVEAIRQALLQLDKELAAKRERERLAELALEEISPECCTLTHPLFLRYFLQNAFYWAEGQGQENLYTLLEEEFPSNAVWNRRLAQEGLSRTIPLTRYGTDENGQSIEHTLEIQIVFHQFYVEYRMDGQELCNPLLPFWGLSQLEDDEVFLLLLPVLSAYREELEDAEAHLRERLARLGLPEGLISPAAAALAGEAACLVSAEGGTAILRPARFCRESEEKLCCCLWYGNGRLLTFRRTAEELTLQNQFCRDNVPSLEQAGRIAEEIFKEVFSPPRGLVELEADLCSHLHVEYSGMPSQDFAGDAITPALLEQLFQKFEKKWITRLVVNHELVLLWSRRSFVTDSQPGTCALLRFHDDSKSWDALLSDWESYYYGQAGTSPQIPFRMGSLPDYAVHSTPKKAIDALSTILNGVASGNGRWSDKVYRNNRENNYYFVKRALGGFSLEESGGPLLRHRYVLSKLPSCFSCREPGEPLATKEVNTATRLTVTDMLVRFELGGLEYLSLSWQLEDLGAVHLVLFHEKTDTGRRELAVLIQDHEQMIQYLVGDQKEYMDREKKVPKGEFWGRMLPRYLIHHDFVQIRDFLDLFFLSLPRPEALLQNSFATLAFGPDSLTKLGFEEHRRLLLEPQERKQNAARLSAQECRGAKPDPKAGGEEPMEFQVIPQRADIPSFDADAIKIRHIRYFEPPYQEYGEEEITEEIVGAILKKLPDGLNIYLSLNPDGEDDWLEVNCDSRWISLGFSRECGQDCYCSYNPAFAHTASQIMEADFSDKRIYTPLESGGQSPIPKMQALTDIGKGVKAVEYFIRTGELYPGIDWMHEC